METIKLSDWEQKHYELLFQSYDIDKNSKVPKARVLELLASSGIGNDVLLQILDLCGASRLGYCGRSQFYIALKLVAVAQTGYPTSPDILASGIPTPLPCFGLVGDLASSDVPDLAKPAVPSERHALMGIQQQHTVLPPGVIPPPPVKGHTRTASGMASFQDGPHALAVLPSVLPHHTNPLLNTQSAPNVLTNSSLPHVNSADGDLGWASFEGEVNPAASANMMSDNGFLRGPSSSAVETSSVSSEYATSEGESVDDIWSINDEQKEYYIKQFKTMQPDLNAVINGTTAKEFFEKSKLPTRELSKIWQLSDVNRDGALSLEEFCTAMHLVVLRRNDVELPSQLPPSLVPYIVPTSDEPFVLDLPPGSTIKRVTPSTPPNNQWAFMPASPPEDLSSPLSTKLVSFDAQPVSDPDIVHPVPVKMSPNNSSYAVSSLDTEKTRTSSDPVPFEHDELLHPVLSRQRSNTETRAQDAAVGLDQGYTPAKLYPPLQGRPRPTPAKKTQSVPGGAISSQEPLPLLQPPPPSALLGQQLPVPVAPPAVSATNPPIVPPRNKPLPTPEHDVVRFSDGDAAALVNFADFSDFVPDTPSSNQGDGGLVIHSQSEEKSLLNSSNDENGSDGPVVHSWSHVEPMERHREQLSTRGKKEISSSIKRLRERNTMLSRLNSELNQELQEVMEQRIALEIQLEHLKPC